MSKTESETDVVEYSLLACHLALNVMPNSLPDLSTDEPGITVRISLSAKRVAAAIIDHYNHKTGRCDPAINRLRWLLGCDEATVIRALDSLERAGLIERKVHGGRHHKNLYLPNWGYFSSIFRDWNSKMRTGAKVANLQG